MIWSIDINLIKEAGDVKVADPKSGAQQTGKLISSDAVVIIYIKKLRPNTTQS